jgi:hypothetical protein
MVVPMGIDRGKGESASSAFLGRGAAGATIEKQGEQVLTAKHIIMRRTAYVAERELPFSQRGKIDEANFLYYYSSVYRLASEAC